MTDAAYLLDFLRAHGVPKIVKKRHSYLAYYGNKQPYTHILETGVVKTSIILKNGREFNIAYLNAPDIISLLRDEVSSYTSEPYNVRVETDCASFYQVSRVVFWKWINHDQKLQSFIKNYYRGKLAESIQRQQTLTMNGKKGAVCGLLLSLDKRFGVLTEKGRLIDFTITDEDIAGFCGVSSRSSANRIMQDLKKSGVIEAHRNKILIRDLSALKDIVGE